MSVWQAIHTLGQFTACLTYFSLGGFILYKKPRALLNRMCCLLLVSFALWSMGYTVLAAADSKAAAMLGLNIAALGWCSFPVPAFWFYLAFTGHNRVLRNRLLSGVCIAAAILFVCLQWTGYLANDLARQSYGWSPVWSDSLWVPVFSVYYAVLVVVCIYLSFVFARRAPTPRERKAARVLYIAPIPPLIGSSLTDVVLPQLGIMAVPPIGDIIVLVWAAALVYAVSRYGLMGITPAEAAEDILAVMGESLMLVGPDGRVVRANREALHLLGYEEAELVGKEFDSIASSGGEKIEGSAETAYLTSSGQAVPVLLSVSEIKDRMGEPQGLVAVARDISERKKMEEDLRQSEARYRSLVEHALVGITIHQQGKIVYANEAIASMLGYDMEQGTGMSLADLIHPDDRGSVLARAKRRQLGFPEPETYELRLLKKDGGALNALISNAVINYNGAAATLVTIADVSDTKARKELELANKELEAFSYSVSHDLRAPLRSIDGFSQALLEDYEDKLDEEGRDYLRRVRAASQRMAQLIDDLLNLSRVSRAELRFEEVNLSALAEGIVAELRNAEPERQVEFVVAQDVTAYGDPHLLEVVLENLLRNAWKFTSKHASARIEFGVTEGDGDSAYFVRDNGAGFDMSYAGKLFTPFQRLHAEAEFPGTGIGLATAQRVVHRHGGRVWAEGEVEKGATFYFTLQSQREKV